MKSKIVVSVLIFFTGLVQADETLPSGVASVNARCEILLEKLLITSPPVAQHAALIAQKRALEVGLSQQLTAQHSIARQERIDSMVLHERIMLMVASGQSDEAVDLLRPLTFDARKAFSDVIEQVDLIHELSAKWARTKSEDQRLAEAKDKYIQLSYIFGEQYGAYSSSISLVRSVADGKGAANLYGELVTRTVDPAVVPLIVHTLKTAEPNTAVLPEPIVPTPVAEPADASVTDPVVTDAPATAKPSVKPAVATAPASAPARPAAAAAHPIEPAQDVTLPSYATVYALNNPLAIATANRILTLLNPELESRWFLNAGPHAPPPSLEEMHVLYTKNIYALIGYLQKANARQAAGERVMIQVSYAVADFYMSLTSYDFVPAQFRKVLLQIMGIAYDDYMIHKYIDKIRAVVDVSRVRSAIGNIVIINDPQVLDLQLKKLSELGSDPLSDDLLVTFARLSYFTDAWSSLMARASVRAQESSGYSQAYLNLYGRMKKAETRAAALGPLPYVYSKMPHYRLLLLQFIYAGVTEEIARHSWIPAKIAQMLPYFN